MSETKPTDQPPSPKTSYFKPWNWLGHLFESLQWFTERVINLLRLFVTIAMFAVVAFIIYHGWASRNTVAVKPFHVPVAMGKDNHEQAGRIIANLLNRHLLEAQNTLQEQLNRGNNAINIAHPVAAEEQILIEGDSIKLPETGITIDNVIEFISGIFGRKNLNGSVYFEADTQHPEVPVLNLQITLRGRIISISEHELGPEKRKDYPATQRNGLNIQLISAMLKARSKDILSIASEDYNLYYYCTREVPAVEHNQGKHNAYFSHCRDLRDANTGPKTLHKLLTELDAQEPAQLNDSVLGPVLSFLRDESRKKLSTLCQSADNADNEACTTINATRIAQAVTSTPTTPTVNTIAPVLAAAEQALQPIITESATISYSLNATRFIDTIHPILKPIPLGSFDALRSKCHSPGFMITNQQPDIVAPLETRCFSQTEPPPQQQQLPDNIASPEAILQANQLEADATQLLHNGLYQPALEKYQQSIRLNCGNAVAWANLGILLSTAKADSGVRDAKQGQCALLRATELNDNAGWMRHSLCVAQAMAGKTKLEDYLSYQSCQQARQLEPINEALYDKLFMLNIAKRYRELGQPEQALNAYRLAMKNETTRSCHLRKTFVALTELADEGLTEAKEQACQLYQNSRPSLDQQATPECELELDHLAAQQGC